MAKIESFVQPRWLYRYRSLANIDREIEAIKDGYLYCSSYTAMNDPMEGMFESHGKLARQPDYPEIREAIRGNKDSIGICSFSEVNNHELMWAHYADQYKGICIAYSLSR